MTRVNPLAPAAAPAWDAFVAAHPHGTFFHRAAWRDVIARGFGHEPRYLLAERDGAIVGVLPLVSVRTRLFGHSLMSLPFCVYGGPLAADGEAFAALADAAAALMDRSGAKVLEWRFLHAPDPTWLDSASWPSKDLYYTFRRPITADDDANLKAIPRKQRAMVRKGIDRGLVSRTTHELDGFYRIYAESVRNLGTPVFSRRYFSALAEAFAGSLDITTVFDGDTPVASVLSFYDRGEVNPYYGGGTDAARECHAYDFMYWEVMRRAAARGCTLFDYGRSKQGTGPFSFKKNWGFEPQPLAYRFRLRPGEAVPDINPLNPKYQRFIAAWKRLPLPVANLVGPHIVRGIG